MSKKVSFPQWMLLLTLMFAVAAFAQTTASIKGTVTDQTGAAVVGAKVTIKAAALGIERTAQTNNGGDYEVPALPPGNYSVEIQMAGFQPQQANNLVLAVSQKISPLSASKRKSRYTRCHRGLVGRRDPRWVALMLCRHTDAAAASRATSAPAMASTTHTHGTGNSSQWTAFCRPRASDSWFSHSTPERLPDRSSAWPGFLCL